MTDLRLIAIASPPLVEEMSVVEACQAAESGGATAVQVRFKHSPASVLLSITDRLVATLSIPVYVNDRSDIALAAGASGVHLGAEDIPAAKVRQVAPRPFKIGVSVGTDDEAHAVLGTDVDYWSIGSIYTTGSKSDAGPPIGIAGFTQLARLAPNGIPTIAIGGIDESNAGPVIESGAAGIAVISAVFGTSSVERNTRSLRNIVDECLRN
jgi:thiamine-phosphate pyrophosphorylase